MLAESEVLIQNIRGPPEYYAGLEGLMSRTAGRRPPQPPRPPSVSSATSTYEQLFPADPTRVECRLCHTLVPSIPDHLRSDHPRNTLVEYTTEFPDAPLAGQQLEVSRRRRRPGRDAVKRHPGGRPAAEIEAELPETDREAYRESVADLVRQGYEPGQQVADLAYYMALARRVRVTIEHNQRKSGDFIVSADYIEDLSKVQQQIKTLRDQLDKQRASSRPESNPVTVLETEMAQAEAFVKAHIGELIEDCQRCGGPVTPPALPHWAYVPIVVNNVTYWAVWSSEIWRMVQRGIMPVWQMAYILRTSPEGLKITAGRRGDAWPDSIVLEDEERALRKMLDLDDAEPPQEYTPLPPPAEGGATASAEGALL